MSGIASTTRSPSSFNTMRNVVCKVDGCDQPFRARGFCGKHYQLWKRGRLPGFVSPDGTLGFSADGPTWALDAALAGQPARLTDGRVWVAGADVTPG